MTDGAAGRRKALLAGLLAVSVTFAWQALVIHYTYAGNWSAWFCTGGNLPQPPLAASEHLYVFKRSNGYDGQYYHYIAHDPFCRRETDRYLDAPRLRYRRILMPGLAYLAAMGQDRAIDAAVFAVNLFAIFMGVYWSSRYAVHWGYGAAWGLLFLLVPAVLVSLDRFVVDPALAALTVGFALYVIEDNPPGVFAVLLFAPLARETGVVLVAAQCGSLLMQRRLRSFLLFASSLLPALAWYAFVSTHVRAEDTTRWFAWPPLARMLRAMLHVTPYPFIPSVKSTAQATDIMAFLGVLLAIALGLYLPKLKLPLPFLFAMGFLAVFAALLGRPVWVDAFAFSRVVSPLVVLVALSAYPARSWIRFLPLALIDPRIGLQLSYRLFLVAKALFT